MVVPFRVRGDDRSPALFLLQLQGTAEISHNDIGRKPEHVDAVQLHHILAVRAEDLDRVHDIA
ncbi:hypothetical protein [Streptomyces sp. NPDC093600]|uniref:hypothetical protein n=1 Tax=Streptomyces sp. NPDC093600 TaxID=3366047 RepID=UPI003809BC59